MGTTKELDILRNQKSLLKDVGVSGLNIHYIGGLHVLLAFDVLTDAVDFRINKAVWEKWFTKLDDWHGQSLSFQRITWLRVIGVPLHLSDEVVYKLLGGSIGKVIHKSQVSWNNGDLSIDCIGVLVGEGKRIAEEIKLKWRNKSFRVWVTEEIGLGYRVCGESGGANRRR